MKRSIYIAAVLTALSSAGARAQTCISDSAAFAAINQAAILELQTTKKGLLMPRLTNTQMNAITTPPAGLVIYNTDVSCLHVRIAARWVNMCDDTVGNFWDLRGNSLTNPGTAPIGNFVDGNFAGTRDAQNFVVATNGRKRMIFDQNGSAVGGSASTVTNTNSFVWGANNKSTGSSSLVSGSLNIDSAQYSLVSGLGNTVAPGAAYSITGGNANRNAATYSIVAGSTNTVTATARNSAVFGESNYHAGNASLMYGRNNIDSSENGGFDLVGGSNNIIHPGNNLSSESAVIGRGNDITNLFTGFVAGMNNKLIGTTPVNRLFILGLDNIADPDPTGYSTNFVTGVNNYLSKTHNSVIMGDFDSIQGGSNYIMGSRQNIKDGTGNVALGGSIADGGGQTDYSFTDGANNFVFGGSDNVTGSGNFVGSSGYPGSLNPNATVIGSSNAVVGGNGITIKGNYDLVTGSNNKDSAGYGFISGANNVLGATANFSAIIGNGLTGTAANTLYANNVYVPGSMQYGSLTAISDRRFKSNFAPLGYGLSTVMQLQPKEYDQVNAYRVKNGRPVTTDNMYTGSHHSFGFIAQDLYKVIPEVVKKPVDEQNDNWGVDYVRLVPVLAKAIQDQQAMIANQQAMIVNQQKQVDELKALIKQ